MGPVRLEHGRQGTDPLLVCPVEAIRALLSDVNDAGAAEDREVLRDGSEGDRKGSGNVACAQLLIPDQAQDLAPPRRSNNRDRIHEPYFSAHLNRAVDAVTIAE